MEVCIDVCRHLVSRNRLRAPSSFADAFTVLAEGGVIDAALAVGLADMAKFRNLLVHGYARVDDRQVMAILHCSPRRHRRLRQSGVGRMSRGATSAAHTAVRLLPS